MRGVGFCLDTRTHPFFSGNKISPGVTEESAPAPATHKTTPGSRVAPRPGFRYSESRSYMTEHEQACVVVIGTREERGLTMGTSRS